jgi:hypothetical protein
MVATQVSSAGSEMFIVPIDFFHVGIVGVVQIGLAA